MISSGRQSQWAGKDGRQRNIKEEKAGEGKEEEEETKSHCSVK